MATRPDKLYEDDFYAWTRDQAVALRRLAEQRWNGPLDLEHLAEELEDLGSAQQWAVESQLERVIEHLLELEHSPSPAPRRQWMISVVDARGEIEPRITPAIRREVEPALSSRYRRARRKAELALLDHGEKEAARALPADCPYVFDELIADEWSRQPARAARRRLKSERWHPDPSSSTSLDPRPGAGAPPPRRQPAEPRARFPTPDRGDGRPGHQPAGCGRSELRRIIEHCLKLEYSPAHDPRVGWHETIIDARIVLEDKLARTLRRGLQRRLPVLYDQARRVVDGSLRLHGEAEAADALPAECPYRLADLLRHDWHPASRHGLTP